MCSPVRIGVPAKYHSEARTLRGASWRRRHAKRAAEPARIVELPAKIKIILQTIYHAISRHLRARFAYLDLLPPSKNPAVWLGSCLVGGGGFEPPKSSTTDLQSAPFGHSGILPWSW